MANLTHYGDTALITGASSGIGKSFARAIAAQGLNVVLVARREALLDELATELANAHNITAHAIALDLSDADAAEQLVAKLSELEIHVDVLINNAGYGTHGIFDELDLERELQMINLSCRLPVALTHHLIKPMKQRNRGAIIFLSSVAGTMPAPFMSTYSATKAFPLFFAESLYGELAGTGIDVLAVAPGDTATEFRDTANFHNTVPLPPRTPDQVVAAALAALGKKPSTIDGLGNKLTALSMRFTPKKLAIKLGARIWKV